MKNLEFIFVNENFFINNQDSYNDALRKLKASQLECLPLVNKNKYEGLLHRHELVERFDTILDDKHNSKKPISSFINKNAEFDMIDNNDLEWLEHLIKSSKFYKHSFTPIVNHDGSFKCFAYSPSEKEISRILSEFIPSITIIGMGYVGVTLAVVMANSGFKVTCIEKNVKKRKLLKNGQVPFYETGLTELFEKLYKENKIVIKSPTEKNLSNFIVITVGTPLKTDKNNPNIEYLNNALDIATKQLSNGGVIVLRSTVPVGSTLKIKQKNFNQFVQYKIENTKYFAFCPERTLEGKALEELKTNPQIIGSESAIARGKIKKVFDKFVNQTIELPGVTEAELVKLSDNTFRDISFAFSNSLSNISMKYGIDTISVIEAANKDYQRTNIPYPSPGVGGPCLSKDAYILTYGLKNIDNKVKTFFESGRNISDLTINEIVNKIENLKKELSSSVLLCGMAFKGEPVTDDLRDSTSVNILNKLIERNVNVKIWDPLIPAKELKKVFNKNIISLPPWKLRTQKELLIILANNSPQFSKIDWNKIINKSEKLIIVDCWGVCKYLANFENSKLSYYRLGKNL